MASQRREHSRKPDEAYARIEQYSAGPRADLFAREAGEDGIFSETNLFGRMLQHD